MKKVLISLALLATPSLFAGAWRQQNAQKLNPNRGNAARGNGQLRPAQMRDAMMVFYVTEFKTQTDISQEVYDRILPLLEEFVQNRLEISQRRTRAINQIRQAIRGGAADEDLTKLKNEVDAADVDAQSNQEKFVSRVDPLLTPKQQARLRVFQVNADNKLRQYLDTVQNANRGQR